MNAKAATLICLLPACTFGLVPFAPSGSDSGLPGESDADTDSDSDADADTDTDTDTDTDPGGITIDRVSPGYGSTAGGTQVTIEGGPFDSSALVRFGGTAADVVTVGNNELVVETPSASAEGYVDVTVATDDGSGSLTSGFQYLTDGTGLAGAMGTVEWVHYNGSYWDGGTTDYGSAYIIFTEPTDAHWWDIYAPLDSCEDESYEFSGDIYAIDQSVSSITLTPSTGSAITATWDANYYGYLDDTLANNQFSQNGSYDLGTVTGDYYPPFSVSGFVKTPTSFSVSTPAISGTTPPNITRSQTINWTAGSADRVLIMMGLVNSAGTDYDQFIYCVATDDGAFAVPSSTWTSWPSDRQVNIWVGKAMESGALLDFNNSESRVLGIYWNFGAGFSR
jgi:IPT/TIG domain